MCSLSPKKSTVRARIPLSDRDFFQRLKYRLADEHIRTGRILEDFGKLSLLFVVLAFACLKSIIVLIASIDKTANFNLQFNRQI